jgi:hypothetical protein
MPESLGRGRETAVVPLGDVGRVSGGRGIDARVRLRKGPPPGLDAVAGSYFGLPDPSRRHLGFGMTLKIEADGSFVCYSWQCFGSVDVYGSASLDGGRLKLRDAHVGGTDWGLVGPAYEPILWDGRTYLVPADRMDDFCWAVAQGVEDDLLAWGVFLPDGRESAPPRGWPSVPERYRHYFSKFHNFIKK